MANHDTYATLTTSLSDFVLTVSLRLKGGNPFNDMLFSELRTCFHTIKDDPNVRCCVVEGTGKHFTIGLDLKKEASKVLKKLEPSRKACSLMKLLERWSTALDAIAECGKPVIVLVHGYCIGGGIDLISACDIRLCSRDTVFCIKETDLGLVPDIGTMARVPKIIGNDSLFRKLAMTARNFSAEEALRLGLVSSVLEDRNLLKKRGYLLAQEIASKAPMTLYCDKEVANYAQDHGVANSIKYAKICNVCFSLGSDLARGKKFLEKSNKYSKL